mgnify:CR=1 FL=1
MKVLIAVIDRFRAGQTVGISSGQRNYASLFV